MSTQIEPRYSLREAAKLTSLSLASLHRAIAAGALQAHRLGERRTVVRATDLQAFIAASERPLSQAPITVAVRGAPSVKPEAQLALRRTVKPPTAKPVRAERRKRGT